MNRELSVSFATIAAAGAFALPEASIRMDPPQPPENICDEIRSPVFAPERLKSVEPCVVVSGTIVKVREARDGDVHIDVRPDYEDKALLNKENKGVLIVEPTCMHDQKKLKEMERENEEEDKYLRKAALKACNGYKNPIKDRMPKVGQHVIMYGQHVLDVGHTGWAEIHPLSGWEVYAEDKKKDLKQKNDVWLKYYHKYYK